MPAFYSLRSRRNSSKQQGKKSTADSPTRSNHFNFHPSVPVQSSQSSSTLTVRYSTRVGVAAPVWRITQTRVDIGGSAPHDRLDGWSGAGTCAGETLITHRHTSEHTHTHTPGSRSPFAACLEQKRCDISSCVSPGAGDPDLLDYSALLPLLE